MVPQGNPYDNAKAESFMKTLKTEAVYPMAYETFEQATEHPPHFLEEVYDARLCQPAAIRGSAYRQAGKTGKTAP